MIGTDIVQKESISPRAIQNQIMPREYFRLLLGVEVPMPVAGEVPLEVPLEDFEEVLEESACVRA